MKRIFIIDDDVHIGNMLEEILVKEGYSVLRAYSGTEALMVLINTTPDLILLDLMLPGLSGEELLAKIKNIPVIVVSAKVDIDSKVKLLLDGAVDYITKPFETKELLARITVALRNTMQSANSIIKFDELTLDINLHTLYYKDTVVKLTNRICHIKITYAKPDAGCNQIPDS